MHVEKTIKRISQQKFEHVARDLGFELPRDRIPVLWTFIERIWQKMAEQDSREQYALGFMSALIELTRAYIHAVKPAYNLGCFDGCEDPECLAKRKHKKNGKRKKKKNRASKGSGKK